ncbi:anhydro-N-acetylmuramic acid kinase [Amylibacter marinus]|uniref:Anhydro-N-acetylmuramic acid kinase n=1 Tax=Amylibacter marinus TaxID=1475483 RepID=A0ABQ5VSB4_9RHOB|nr:anhydro-N-acetylmuramic acid kinase [Amylibacter marinus]GLQ34261.1 anhydro-N-acetylmuramic acid kinase [Amylibacter marinus]
MSQNQIYRALGLMSGTSLDGVDGAVCITDGQKILGFEGGYYRPYSDQERAVLHGQLGKWPEGGGFDQAQEIIHKAHIEVIAHFPDADIIGFHGQTLNHDPKQGRTFQLGDGAALAHATGRRVVWDFRSEDVAAGGQGAPLAPFFHFACAKTLGLRTPIAFLNLGGVGNVSWIDPSKPNPDSAGAILAFDTGPANAPINDFVAQRLSVEFDKDGGLAASGQVNTAALEQFFKHPYFETKPPKSLDRNDFADIQDVVSDLNSADGAATLTAIATSSAYAAQMYFAEDPSRWLVCGGGRKNTTIMTALRQMLTGSVDAVEAVGFDGDMFEAQAFGFLAARVVNGLPTSAPSTTGCPTPICGGQISPPL